jgi:Tfp pilus assembly protein PilX
MMITQRSNKNINQQGVVSLFIVLFTALLMTIVTISFVQLMTSDQRQATNSDLSESAYDSALAGVEDAKRLLLLQQDCKDGTAGPTANCAAVASALTLGKDETQTSCDTLAKAGIVAGDSNETILQQQSGDRKLDQAYTCVKIKTDTPNYLGTMNAGDLSVLVPLRATQEFNRITVSWDLSKDGGPVDLPAAGSTGLPKMGASSWPQNRPALLRTQLINGLATGSNFHLSDFDPSNKDAYKFSATLFLYPVLGSPKAPTSSFNFTLDSRLGGAGNQPYSVLCNPAVVSGGYTCTADLDLPTKIPSDSQVSFLNLAAFYNATDFKVELRDASGNIVPFHGVQPEVDSTGRANDLFRRVVSRVEMGGSFNYPQAAIETTGKLCKNFFVTTEQSDYDDSGCKP